MEFIYKNQKGERTILNFSIGKAPDRTKIDGIVYERDFEAELNNKQFCLKGGGWPGQDFLRKRQMTENNESAGKRTKETWGDSASLVPNYKGKECEDWNEAANLSKKDKEQ